MIDNRLATNLSVRLSLDRFQTNPLQRGCTNAAAAAPGCATVALFANGFSAPTVAQTADEAGFGRHDTRNWEHDFDSQTTWRTQAVFDDKNINQPLFMTAATTSTGVVAGQFRTKLDRLRRGRRPLASVQLYAWRSLMLQRFCLRHF